MSESEVGPEKVVGVFLKPDGGVYGFAGTDCLVRLLEALPEKTRREIPWLYSVPRALLGRSLCRTVVQQLY